MKPRRLITRVALLTLACTLLTSVIHISTARAASLELTVPQIQGTGSRSAHEGQAVKTTGVVYDVANNGFWMQDPNGDGNPMTSDGIFVLTSSAPTVQKGDSVSVEGTVREVGDPNAATETELTSASVTVLSNGNPLPSPVTITTADFDPNGGIDQLERYEGMRVHIDSLDVIAPTGGVVDESTATAVSNGVFFGVVTGLPRPFRAAGIELPATPPAGSPCCFPSWNGAPQRIRVDSATLSSALDVTTGVTVTDLTGPLDFAQHTYTVVTETTPTPLSENFGPSGVDVPGDSEFTIASFDLQRFFDSSDQPAKSDVILTPAAFNNRLNKAALVISDILLAPDVIGVQEVENLSTLQALANRVNSNAIGIGQANPGYSAFVGGGNDSSGLNVGFLVKSRITVNSVNQFGKDDTYVDPSGTTALINDRPPLVLDATFTNQQKSLHFTAIVAHQLSQNGIDDLLNGAGVREKRRAQAEYLATLIQSFQAGKQPANIVVLGNFNAFSPNDGYADVMGTLTGNPTPASQVVLASSDLVDPNLTDLETTLSPDQQYSYISLGTAETLDHVLANPNMLESFSRFEYARSNADYPESYRSDPTRPERLSDHDMPVAYFDLAQDMTPPVLNLPADLTVEATSGAGAVVTYTATALDSKDGPTEITCNPSSGSAFPLGANGVSCSSQDSHGNVANGAFNVNVVDTTAPSLTIPADFVVGATSANGAVVSYSASALDTVDGSTTVLCNPSSGSTFAIGVNTVSCTTQDAHHNVANGSFNVNVVDNTPPVLTLPTDITVGATSASGATITYSASALDVVDGPTAVTCSPASGSKFALGTTTVSCSSQDTHHNSTSGSFHVNVADTTAPVLTLPADVTAAATSSAGAVVTYSASALDAIDGPTAVTCSPASGSTFPVGTTTVSCSTQDAHHNAASGAFHVNVVGGSGAPPPIVKVTRVSNGGKYRLGSVPVAGCSTMANGSPVAVKASLSITGGTANKVGAFTATCSGARDVAGRVAPSVSATYTVSYVWSGFLTLGWHEFETGSIVPLKWALLDSHGRLSGSLSSFVSLKIATNSNCFGAPEGAPFPAATTGNGLTYAHGLFQTNWKTAGMKKGCYSVLLGLDDGSTRAAIVRLKSKGDKDGPWRRDRDFDNHWENHDDDHQWSFVERFDDHNPANPNKK